MVGVSLHDLGALMAVVVLVGGAVGIPALGEDDDVGGAAEGIGVDGAGAQVDIGVVTGSLLGGGTVEVPDRKVGGLPVLLVECLNRKCQSWFAILKRLTDQVNLMTLIPNSLSERHRTASGGGLEDGQAEGLAIGERPLAAPPRSGGRG